MVAMIYNYTGSSTQIFPSMYLLNSHMEYIFHSCMARVGDYFKDFTDYKLTSRLIQQKFW